MKKLHFIVQAKGGVGKSLLTYLIALAKEQNENCFFVDVDSSTKTSVQQLKFLGENRQETLSLLDRDEYLIRDNLIQYLEAIQEAPFTEFVFDFGAAESEQLPALIFRDIPFGEFLQELGYEVVFHVVIAGGSSYTASVAYMHKMFKILNGEFDILVWQNLYTFQKWEALSEELAGNCRNIDLKLIPFGHFEPKSNIGAHILEQVRKGNGINSYPIGARLRMKKELKENIQPIFD